MSKRVPEALAVRFEVRDKHSKRFVTVKRGGKLYLVGGVPVKLFTVKVYAEAVDRTPHTIVGWERLGLIPKPMWKLPGERQIRVYSEAQILAANEVWKRHRQRGKGRHISQVDFTKELTEVFYKADLERLAEHDKKESEA